MGAHLNHARVSNTKVRMLPDQAVDGSFKVNFEVKDGSMPTRVVTSNSIQGFMSNPQQVNAGA